MTTQGLLAPILSALMASAPAAAQEDTFEETTSVLVVEVPVRVLDDGRPVRGLTADDFVLYDAGERVERFDFEVLEFGPDSPRGARPPAVEEVHPWLQGRSYLFVYDFALNTNRRMLHRAAVGIERALDRGMGPDDRVGIALFRGHEHLQYVLDFTSDRRQIRAALAVVDEMLRGDFWETRRLLGELRSLGPPAVPSRRFGNGWGRRPILPVRARRFTGLAEVPSDPLTAETLALFDYRFVSGRMRVLNFTRSLTEMAESTRGLSGQKHLILLSAGFSDRLLFGDRWTSGTLSVIRRVLRAFRAENWALQGVNAGLWSGDASTALFHLAHETGGELFTNSNDVALLLEEVLEHTEVVYLLSFQPRDLQHNGRFRRLRVELVDGPRGARVIHRPAYRAPEPAGR